MNRVVVQEQLFHQSGDMDPTSVGRPWSSRLVSDEQPYQRIITVKQGWVILDFGWLQECSMLYIRNRAGADLEVAIGPEDPGVILPAREDMRLPQCKPGGVRFRCIEGESQVQYVVFPK